MATSLEASLPNTASSAAAAVAEQGSSASFSSLHSDIIESHILTRLDGPSLASASCSSAVLHHISSQVTLWSRICQETWPSTATPRISEVIETFPNGGPRAFFANSFPLPLLESNSNKRRSSNSPSPSELMSAVDIHYKSKLIFTKVQETETVTGWFQCSPFRIDLLEPKDVFPTPIKHPEGDDACGTLADHMALSWILIDPIEGRAVNLSSQRPVSVQRHWLSGEVQVRFSSILAVDQTQKRPLRTNCSGGFVQCEIVVTCGASEGGEMQVREVSMEMEDMDGMHLNGKDSLAILQRALEGKKGKGATRAEEGRKRYQTFLDKKRERREKRLRTEGTLDTMCIALGVLIIVAFWCFILCR